jgi:hypothetical protein
VTAFWVFLALLVGAVACRVAWTRGQESARVEWFHRGEASERTMALLRAEAAEAARQAEMTANRRQGAKAGWVRRKGGV